MKIFNVILNGSGAKEFCHQTEQFKIDWILKHTNQTDMGKIMEFIKNPPKHEDCGCGCGEKKVQAVEEKIIPVVMEDPIEPEKPEKPLNRHQFKKKK